MTRRRRLISWAIQIGTALPIIAILIAALDFWAAVVGVLAVLVANVGSAIANSIWDGTTRHDLRNDRDEATELAADLLLRNAALQRDLTALGEKFAHQRLAQLDEFEEKLIEDRVALLFQGGFGGERL